jgi:hypothetical protein
MYFSLSFKGHANKLLYEEGRFDQFPDHKQPK